MDLVLSNANVSLSTYAACGLWVTSSVFVACSGAFGWHNIFV